MPVSQAWRTMDGLKLVEPMQAGKLGDAIIPPSQSSLLSPVSPKGSQCRGQGPGLPGPEQEPKEPRRVPSLRRRESRAACGEEVMRCPSCTGPGWAAPRLGTYCITPSCASLCHGFRNKTRWRWLLQRATASGAGSCRKMECQQPGPPPTPPRGARGAGLRGR